MKNVPLTLIAFVLFGLVLSSCKHCGKRDTTPTTIVKLGLDEDGLNKIPAIASLNMLGKTALLEEWNKLSEGVVEANKVAHEAMSIAWREKRNLGVVRENALKAQMSAQMVAVNMAMMKMHMDIFVSSGTAEGKELAKLSGIIMNTMAPIAKSAAAAAAVATEALEQATADGMEEEEDPSLNCI
jgi:hypothetical protein